MASRRPLVIVSGLLSELPAGDTVIAGATLAAGSGLSGGGALTGSTVTLDVSLATNASGLIFVGDALGIDGVVQTVASAAQASGNAALVVGTTALASGNAALVNISTLSARNLVAGSGLLGGGNLSADRRFDADISSQAIAQSGTDNTTLMTPLRVAQAIAVQGSSYTYTSTGSNKILANKERCTAISGLITLSLPAAPSQGGEVSVIIPSGSINVVLSGVGYPIMGVQQDLTIDAVDTTVTLIYIGESYGWRIF